MILSSATLSVAYIEDKPNFILGKKENGEINIYLLILNFPWLVFTWTIFRVQMFVSQENIVDHVKGTKIYISSRPLNGFDFSSYNVIVDLTAEFLKDEVINQKYICYSNLDGMPLTNSYNDINIFAKKTILVHCANGHRRSALFVAQLLLDLGLVQTFAEGVERVKKSRPLAKV